ARRYSSITRLRDSRSGRRERAAMSSTMRRMAPIVDSSVSAARTALRISRRPMPAMAWQRACALPQKPASPQYLQLANSELLLEDRPPTGRWQVKFREQFTEVA